MNDTTGTGRPHWPTRGASTPSSSRSGRVRPELRATAHDGTAYVLKVMRSV